MARILHIGVEVALKVLRLPCLENLLEVQQLPHTFSQVRRDSFFKTTNAPSLSAGQKTTTLLVPNIFRAANSSLERL